MDAAAATQEAFHSLWQRYRVLPERYDLARSLVHASSSYYPLRPELAESTYALYAATSEPRYLRMGAEMVDSLNAVCRTPAGFAAIRSVTTLQQAREPPSPSQAELRAPPRPAPPRPARDPARSLRRK